MTVLRNIGRRLVTTRYLVPLVVTIISTAILVLSLIRQPWARIDATVRSSAVTLVTGGQPAEFPPFRVSKLVVLGQGNIDGLTAVSKFQDYVNIEAPPSTGEGKRPPSSISMAGLKVGAHSKVVLRHYPGADRTFEFLVSGIDTLRGIIQGGGQFSVDSEKAISSNNEATSFHIDMREKPYVLRFTLIENDWNTYRPFLIANVDFRNAEIDGDLSTMFSAIGNGIVQFRDIETLSGSARQLDLHPRQMLMIGEIRDGYARNLSIGENSIEIGIIGIVDSLQTVWKTETNPITQDHMPTLLDRLLSIDSVKLLAALFLAVFLAALPLLAPGK
jgi:hypothetical protein